MWEVKEAASPDTRPRRAYAAEQILEVIPNQRIRFHLWSWLRKDPRRFSSVLRRVACLAGISLTLGESLQETPIEGHEKYATREEFLKTGGIVDHPQTARSFRIIIGNLKLTTEAGRV